MDPTEAFTGATLKDIDTPALLLDAAAMERNLQRMAEFVDVSPDKLYARMPKSTRPPRNWRAYR